MALTIPAQAHPWAGSRGPEGNDEGYQIRSANQELVDIVLRCETNGVSGPDGAVPSTGTWAITGTGTYTYTFDSTVRPSEMLHCSVGFEEGDVNIRAVCTGYVGSTGVLSIQTFQEHNYLMHFEAEANDTGAPDAPVPSSGVTWARTSEGLFTATIDSGSRPTYVHGGWGQIAENNVNARLSFVSYAAGVITFITHDDDGTSGVPELEDLDDVTFGITLLCSEHSATPTLEPGVNGGSWVPANLTDKTLTVRFLGTYSADYTT